VRSPIFTVPAFAALRVFWVVLIALLRRRLW